VQPQLRPQRVRDVKPAVTTSPAMRPQYHDFSHNFTCNSPAALILQSPLQSASSRRNHYCACDAPLHPQRVRDAKTAVTTSPAMRPQCYGCNHHFTCNAPATPRLQTRKFLSQMTKSSYAQVPEYSKPIHHLCTPVFLESYPQQIYDVVAQSF
jgi:hypothetical protein